MKSIAIDFGGTAIKMAILKDGKILKKNSIPAWSHKGLAPRLKDTETAVKALLDGERLQDYAGVGISMPGIVDPVRKRPIGLIGKYEDSQVMDLEDWCQKAFGLPMVMEMDSKLALLGELHYGCGKGCKDAVMLILGTGVGTAVAYNGEILKSRNYTAGALSSHLIIAMDGSKCICENHGCLEAMASGWALEKMVKEHPDYPVSGLYTEQEVNFEVLQKWYYKEDFLAVQMVRNCVKAWRTGILNMIHAYDPELVILSGGIMKFRGLYNLLSEGIQDKIWYCCGPVDIKKPEEPENSVLYGLHYLVRQSLKEKDYEG